LIHPVLEQGISDDWSYTRSAQVLAATGHIVYNGWATAMLGWQLYLGALFIRIFGFSFTAVRLSTLLVACATAWLVQRSFVLSGLTEKLATFGTLTLVLSPLLVPLAFTFMTDVPGLFVIALCLYSCLRILTAGTLRAQIGWLLFAVLSNAAGGTVRQIAWLGTLVMIPCLLWLLRRQRVLLAVGIPAVLLAVASIAFAMHWFHAQPYALDEPLLPSRFNADNLQTLHRSLIGAALELPALLLPVLAGFLVPALRSGGRRAGLLVAGTTLAAVATAFWLRRFSLMWLMMAPTLANTITRFGVLDVSPPQGPHAVVLGYPLRLGVTFLSIASLAALLWVSRQPIRPTPAATPNPHLPWLTLPFCGAYFALLLPRAATVDLFDRYLLPLMLFALLGLLHLYQSRVNARVPLIGVGVLALFAGFAVAATHDFFSQYRARDAAIAQMLSSGVPANQIAGGFEFNAWTEILTTGVVADDRLPGMPPKRSPASRDACAPNMAYLSPHLDRQYALASIPDACGGPAGYTPVPYRTWLYPWAGAIYVVRDPGPSSGPSAGPSAGPPQRPASSQPSSRPQTRRTTPAKQS
jgi:hypothetical protein